MEKKERNKMQKDEKITWYLCQIFLSLSCFLKVFTIEIYGCEKGINKWKRKRFQWSERKQHNWDGEKQVFIYLY